MKFGKFRKFRKYCYKIHPEDYALGENEKFYGDMEAKGWRLAKRGVWFSKFAPSEPARARYRMEAVSPGYMESGNSMPEEQLAVYEDCGWEYVTGRQLIHIFRAPEDSGAPEFYEDPMEQAAALKSLWGQAKWGKVSVAVILLWKLFFAGLRSPAANLHWWYEALIQQTAFVLAYLLFIFWLLYSSARGAWYVNRASRRLREGVPLDHNPGERRQFHNAVRRGAAFLIALCLLLTAAQQIGREKRGLPEGQADGPYLLLSDLGWDGERVSPPYGRRENGVAFTRSLLADCWETAEFIDGDIWMYQKVYRLRNPSMMKNFKKALEANSTFGGKGGGENRYDLIMGDLTASIYKDIEIIAIKGDMAADISYIGGKGEDVQYFQNLLSILEERWQEYEK